MKNCLIFIQSSKDVLYALDLIISKEKNFRVSVYITCQKEIYLYVKKYINNKINIFHFEIKKFLSPLFLFQLFRVKFHIFLKLKKDLEVEVYFFSDLHDYCTPLIINSLSKIKFLYQIKNLPIKTLCLNDFSFNEILYKKVSYFFLNLIFEFVMIKNQKVKKFHFNNKIKIIKNYSFKNNLRNYLIKLDNNQKTAIIVLNLNLLKSEKKIISKIIKILYSNKFIIFIKPHPRSKIKNIQSIHNSIISSKLPLELYDITKSTIIIGFSSASLNYPYNKNIKSISLVKFMKNNNFLEYDTDYILSLNKNVFLPNTFEDFETYIKRY